MTLWLDSGTIRTQYIQVESGNEEMTMRERIVDGRPRVEVVIPEGVAFSVDIDGFLSEFSGCEPDVNISDVRGSLTAAQWAYSSRNKMAFVPDSECVITFSAEENALGSAFDPE